jgi:hypothetical protein
MKLLSHYIGAISLLTLATSVLGQTPNRPTLPAQYAEVVLRVDGMT